MCLSIFKKFSQVRVVAHEPLVCGLGIHIRARIQSLFTWSMQPHAVIWFSGLRIFHWSKCKLEFICLITALDPGSLDIMIRYNYRLAYDVRHVWAVLMQSFNGLRKCICQQFLYKRDIFFMMYGGILLPSLIR